MKFRKRENCYYLSTEDKEQYETIDWLIFYWGWYFDISFEICGYFDNRPRINLDLIFFSLTLILPFRNKWKNECDGPKWGLTIHNKTVWIYRGGKGNMEGGNKWWTWDIPFITKDWIRTSLLLKDGTWVHSVKGDKKSFYEEEWKEKRMSWTYNYTDSYDSELIPTIIHVEEREWRPKWLKWTKLFSDTRRYIEIDFLKEVGDRKGSWKGGTIGCSYDLRKNEEPLDCLKRMEKERKF
jgi:hypothetical protein